MTLLTKPEIIYKGAPATIGLNKAELKAHFAIDDEFFQDDSNWAVVSVHYMNEYRQSKTLLYREDNATSEALFKTATSVRADFTLISITIHDYDGGSFHIPASKLALSGLNIEFATSYPPAAPLEFNFAAVSTITNDRFYFPSNVHNQHYAGSDLLFDGTVATKLWKTTQGSSYVAPNHNLGTGNLNHTLKVTRQPVAALIKLENFTTGLGVFSSVAGYESFLTHDEALGYMVLAQNAKAIMTFNTVIGKQYQLTMVTLPNGKSPTSRISALAGDNASATVIRSFEHDLQADSLKGLIFTATTVKSSFLIEAISSGVKYDSIQIDILADPI